MSGPVRSQNRITGKKKLLMILNLREEEVGVVVCRRVGTCLTVALQVTAGRHTACFTINTELEKTKDPKRRVLTQQCINNAPSIYVCMFHKCRYPKCSNNPYIHSMYSSHGPRSKPWDIPKTDQQCFGIRVRNKKKGPAYSLLHPYTVTV